MWRKINRCNFTKHGGSLKGSTILDESIKVQEMEKKIVSEKISIDCKQHVRAINDTQDVLGGKWKVIIIGCLAIGKKRYMELQRMVEGIGSKMLSKELQELELNGLIKRCVLDTKLITVEYELTEYGKTLKPIIDEMASWGMQHRNRVIKEMTSK
jgi:DNA-binding HxlR family transcriptional regulator